MLNICTIWFRTLSVKVSVWYAEQTSIVFIQYLSTGPFNGNMLCSLWGTKWTNKHTYNVHFVLKRLISKIPFTLYFWQFLLQHVSTMYAARFKTEMRDTTLWRHKCICPLGNDRGLKRRRREWGGRKREWKPKLPSMPIKWMMMTRY